MKSLIVCSGKGGVGKTLVATSIIKYLLNKGYRVGAIDLDIDNPNLANFLKVEGEVGFRSEGDKKILVPVKSGNLKIFSMSLIAKDYPISLLGSVSGSLCEDVIRFGDWDDVDLMVADAPAGSGDELRSAVIGFKDTLAGNVIVAQPAHISVAERLIRLHLLNGIAILGLVENMAKFVCEHGSEYYIFGKPMGKELAEKYKVRFFGEIPLSMEYIANTYISSDVIESIANEFINAEVRRPGFIERAVDTMKRISREVLAQVVTDLFLWINKEIPINEIQKRFNYPGGRIIQFNILSDDGKKLISQEHFMLKDGSLKFVRRTSENKEMIERELNARGVRIYAKLKPLIEAMVGERDVNGVKVPYDLRMAYLNGDVWPEGQAGDMIRTLEVLVEMWEYVRQYKRDEVLKIVGRLL